MKRRKKNERTANENEKQILERMNDKQKRKRYE